MHISNEILCFPKGMPFFGGFFLTFFLLVQVLAPTNHGNNQADHAARSLVVEAVEQE